MCEFESAKMWMASGHTLYTENLALSLGVYIYEADVCWLIENTVGLPIIPFV